MSTPKQAPQSPRGRIRTEIRRLLVRMAEHEGLGTDRDAWEAACKIERLATALRRDIEDEV